jgi:hypothetical protein
MAAVFVHVLVRVLRWFGGSRYRRVVEVGPRVLETIDHDTRPLAMQYVSYDEVQKTRVLSRFVVYEFDAANLLTVRRLCVDLSLYVQYDNSFTDRENFRDALATLRRTRLMTTNVPNQPANAVAPDAAGFSVESEKNAFDLAMLVFELKRARRVQVPESN